MSAATGPSAPPNLACVPVQVLSHPAPSPPRRTCSPSHRVPAQEIKLKERAVPSLLGHLTGSYQGNLSGKVLERYPVCAAGEGASVETV